MDDRTLWFATGMMFGFFISCFVVGVLEYKDAKGRRAAAAIGGEKE